MRLHCRSAAVCKAPHAQNQINRNCERYRERIRRPNLVLRPCGLGVWWWAFLRTETANPDSARSWKCGRDDNSRQTVAKSHRRPHGRSRWRQYSQIFWAHDVKFSSIALFACHSTTADDRHGFLRARPRRLHLPTHPSSVSPTTARRQFDGPLPGCRAPWPAVLPHIADGLLMILRSLLVSHRFHRQTGMSIFRVRPSFCLENGEGTGTPPGGSERIVC